MAYLLKPPFNPSIPSTFHSNSFLHFQLFLHSLLHSFLSPPYLPTFLSAMKLLVKINPKRLFRSKDRSAVSRSNPPSFSSGTSSTSSEASSSSIHKPGSNAGAVDSGTPTSVLPQRSGDWSESSADVVPDIYFELIQAFKILDKDNDGVISRKELEAMLYRLGPVPPSTEEVDSMLNEVDREGDGRISLDALMTRVAGSVTEPACDSELRETFEFFDTDHDGKISAEELLRVFAAIGDERCTLVDCKRMIAGVDINRDGFVCFEDFSRMMDLQRQ